MKEALRFVKGAVAKNDLLPALKHFRIKDGAVLGFNGQMGLCAPIDCGLDIAPNAKEFIRAIEACADDETVSLHVSSNKLVVRCGRFKTHVPLADVEKYPQIGLAGERIDMPGTLLPALECLEPFVSLDENKSWSRGILFEGQFAFATNNIIVAQYWVGFEIPRPLNIPVAAVRELLRIGEEPTSVYLDGQRIVFEFEGGRWLSSQLLESKWPDAEAIIERAQADRLPEAVPEGFFEAVAEILPFVDNTKRVHFSKEKMSTSANANEGTELRVDNVPLTGVFNAEQLAKLAPFASILNLSSFPDPVYFEGDKARGVIVGYVTK